MKTKILALAGLLVAMMCIATGGAATNVWRDSDIRKYLNPENDRTGYAAHFTDAEYELMMGSEVETLLPTGTGVSSTTYKIFLPSGNLNDGMNQIISWGADDLAGLSSTAGQEKYLIPKAYWARPADSYGYSWLRSAFKNPSEDALVYSKQVGVKNGYVGYPRGVAPVFTINTKDVFFASAVSAAEMLKAKVQANKKIEIAKPSDSNTQPDYGMYLKTVYENKKFHVKNLSYSDNKLSFDYAGGMPGDCVVIQAYTNEAQSEGVVDDVVGYAAARLIESGSGSMEIYTNEWLEKSSGMPLKSLAGMTIKVWMENPSRVNLAQATEPQTFVHEKGSFNEKDSVPTKNLRQFAMRNELTCSWGSSPSDQKIYFGMDSNGRPMEFWIADHSTVNSNRRLTLYQAKAVDQRAFDGDDTVYPLSVVPAKPVDGIKPGDRIDFLAMQDEQDEEVQSNGIHFISTNPHVATVDNTGSVKIHNYGEFSIMAVKQGTDEEYEEVGHSEPIPVVNPNPPAYTPAGTPDDGPGDDDGDKDDGDKDDGKENEGKAEDKGEAEMPADLPQTGDGSNLPAFACLLLSSAAALYMVSKRRAHQ